MFIQRLEVAFVSIGIALLILFVFLAACLRFAGFDMSWSTDSAQLIFAWVCFIGADMALRQSRHVGVDMFFVKLPANLQRVIALITGLLILALLIIVVIYGTNLCIANYKRMFQTIPISYSFVTAAAPVGCALMTITQIGKLIDLVRGKKEGN
jgi:TRAP-type C4-dicarboxylate transport system permease small subunit